MNLILRCCSRIAAICLLFLVAACATGPSFEETTSAQQPIPAGKARVTVYRPSVIGAAIQPEIKLDGEVVGKAVPRGYFQVITDPGQHVVSAQTEVEKRAIFNLAAGEEQFVRLEVKFGIVVARIQPVLVDALNALDEIAPLAKTN